MKMIILAAGQGTRLRPLTNNKPKCMVEYNGVPLIDTILRTAEKCNIKDIAIVGGYKKEVLQKHLNTNNCKFFFNENFNKTNMVSTLFYAEDFMNEDIIISYSDIIYTPNVLEKVISTNADFSVVVDKKWKELWQQRMPNPLDDAETLKIKENCILEIGKKASSYKEIEGQYIGLMKISKNIIKEVLNYYKSMDKNMIYDEKNYDNMYMTSFIQSIIDNNITKVTPVYINGGWIEIDTKEDLKVSML